MASVSKVFWGHLNYDFLFGGHMPEKWSGQKTRKQLLLTESNNRKFFKHFHGFIGGSQLNAVTELKK